jgi:Na+-driven multidrug efflux pump
VFNSDDASLISIGSKGLSIFLMMLPIIGVAIVGSNYFQAIAQAKLSMILSLLRQVILLIPLILILPHYYQLTGVWMAQPVADLLSTIITVLVVFKEMRKLNKVENINPKDNMDLIRAEEY